MESDILSDDLVGKQTFDLAELIELDKVYQKTFKFHQVCFYRITRHLSMEWFGSVRVTIRKSNIICSNKVPTTFTANCM